ncbi:DNA repair protein RecO [Rhodothermus marinus]|uniref:DNA repair protein RecO n=1 Tax=Rhodothermus marinus TaxID=29549 RepID=UPI0012BA3EC5|nr:DNA repair protein RecO [Rhodothermus marinus]BBM68579.1 DNA repair protein RecO [Rhodothermus marinus]BBM71547.1 DNA repair protein RecO [Rhodothermus marinus]
MIIRTEAIVLRTLPYGETSLIASLFTRAKGRLSVMAKGARLPGSRFGGTLQPPSCLQVVFYYRPTRELQTLSESSFAQYLSELGRNLEKLTLSLRMVELVHALLPPEEPMPEFFETFWQVLARLDAAPTRAWNLLPWFQLRLAAALGFAPRIERALVEQIGPEGGELALASGQVRPRSADPEPTQPASRAALRAFAFLARTDPDTALRLHLNPSHRHELLQLTEAYLHHHVPEGFPTRSGRVAERLFETLRPGS